MAHEHDKPYTRITPHENSQVIYDNVYVSNLNNGSVPNHGATTTT